MTLAQSVLEGLGPAFRRRAGELLPDLVDALTDEAEQAHTLVQPTGRYGHATAFDATTTPDPQWLGAATGTTIPPVLTLDEQRTYLATRAASRRGTVPAMQAAVRTVLVGTRPRVDILERVAGDPYSFGIRVYEGNLPDGDTPEIRDLIAAAALTEKPLGLLTDIDIEIGPGFGTSYFHFGLVHGTYEEIAEDFPTYDDMIEHEPEEGTPA